MAATQTQLKRHRDETSESVDEETSKRQKYNHLLSILEEEDDDKDKPMQENLSAIFTSLQQELCSPSASHSSSFEPPPPCNTAEQPGPVVGPVGPRTSLELNPGFLPRGNLVEEDEVSVMRRLLEASDDDLGIPSGGDVVDGGALNGINAGGSQDNDGFWEVEDEIANYYGLLFTTFMA
ncbi:unnamed protein product [Cuscuta epithymum]|uniref:Uncharacterized protein n=1 Tax=Cuscuta epithymum TaxID=186058 RepID=A0AAV0DGL3_9ASTE|nr:unnamed protein product [Cuscuta epithymum]